MNATAIGILGGTFDPVHCGHISIARAVAAHFGLPQVRLIPAGTPVHRSPPRASAAHRLAMLRLATAPYPELMVDTRELDSAQRNYTVLTLESLRAEFPLAPLLLIVGADAFARLPSWHQWERLLDFAHIVVVGRDMEVGAYSHALCRVLDERRTEEASALTLAPAGRIGFMTTTAHPASSTNIRAILEAAWAKQGSKLGMEQNAAALTGLLPPGVLAYIARHSLYQAVI